MLHSSIRTGALLALGLVLLPVGVGAQRAAGPAGTIQGVVVDAESGEPLVAASVRLVEAHRTELTHQDGSFTFLNVPEGEYTLVVERLGYGTDRRVVTLRAEETVRPRIELSAAAIQLGEIIVTGTIGAREGREVLSPVSVLSGAELDRRLDGTIASTLESEPGVALTSLGPATARPVIRGLGGDRIVLLEDGLRPGDMSSTSGDHAVAIEPLTAERFEVVRGPMSLLYGSSALGGVVNVVRQEVPAAPHEDVHGAVIAQASSVDRGYAVGGHVAGGPEHLGLRAEASYRTAGELDTPLGDLPNTGTSTLNLGVGGAFVAEDRHAGAAYRFYDNTYGIPGGFVGGHEEGVEIAMRRHTLRGEAELHREDALFESLSADALFSDYHHAELEHGGEIGTEFFQQQLSGKVLARHGERGPFAQGAVGAQAFYRDVQTGGSLRTPSTYDYTFAGFAVEELGRGDLRLQIGARYDWARYVPREAASISVGGREIPVRPRTFGSFSGSLGLLYHLAEPVRLGLSVARAYRTPDFNELYSDGPHLAANSYDVGDPNLSDETGLGFDAFVRVTSERLRGEVAVFRNYLDDYIFPSSRGRAELGRQGGVPRFQYTNEDARFTGAEGDVEWSITDEIVLSGTASYVQAVFTSERAPIPVFEGGDTVFVAASEFPPLIPPLMGRVGARYERPRYFVGGELEMAADQERTGDFETPTDGYAVGNLSAGYRLERGGRLHTLTLRVENLTDAAYRNHLSRIKDLMPQPGRNISLLYRLSF